MSLMWRILLAGGAGAAFVFSFAPFELFWLAPVSLAVLLACCHRQGPGRAFLVGWMFGVGQFGAGVYWVYISIHVFGRAPPAVAAVLSCALIAGLALFPAAVCWLLARLRSRPDAVRHLLLFPASWVAVEWLRTWLFTGFPWLLAGYSHIDTALVGWAPVFGVLGLSLIVALGGSVLWQLVVGPRRQALVGALIVAGFWGAAVGVGAVAWTAPSGPALSVALVQGNIPQDQKWLASNRMPTLALYRGLTAAHWGSDLVVWPEVALPAPYHELRDFIDLIEREARASDSRMLFGLLRYDPASDRYFNSVLALDGRRSFYDKHHLVPFGEYFPVPAFIERQLRLLNLPYRDMGAGPLAERPVTVGRWRVAVSICYEAAFARQMAASLPAADLLVNVSNDAWFGDSIAPHQHLQMARMRAIETGRALLRATNTGITAVVGHRGEVRARLPQFERGVLTGEVVPRSGATPYVLWTDWPVMAVVAIMLAVVTVPAAGRHRPVA